jgi:two-component system copper resistance phosphate regulon response regulator CusR
MRVLVVEDDAALGPLVRRGLQQQRLAVDLVGSVREAIDAATITTYDVVCLDLGLPDGDGLDLCRRLRSQDPLLQRPRRILALTARDAVADRVAGLDAGADDYLVKPFDLAELLARIRALGRRDDQDGPVLEVGDITVDPITHRATRGGVDLALTAKEFTVLRFLAVHAGELVSTEALLEHCWDANADDLTSSVRVILSRLRRKLGEPAVICTVTGAGYRLG